MNENTNSSKKLCAFIVCYSCVLIISQIDILTNNYRCFLESIYEFSISEWLINYEGGFVRRGLIGQLLYTFYDVTRVNIVQFLTVFMFALLVIFTFLFIRKWRQYNLSMFLLPTFVLLGAYWNSAVSFLWFRRDILIYLFVWLVFYFYKKALEKKWYYLLFQITIIVTILSHEASIFYAIPILSLHYFLSNLRIYSIKRSALKTVLLLLPSIGAFFICCYYKGDILIANSIWLSWQPLFHSLGVATSSLGEGVRALTWDTSDTFIFHLMSNFWHPQRHTGIPSFLFLPFVFFAIFYLLVNVNRLKCCATSGSKTFSVLKYMHILLLQYIFMLPMFTVLSCDYGRLHSYCIFSSFLFYFTIPENSLNLFFHKNLSLKVKRLCVLLSSGVLHKKWFFICLYLFSGMPFDKFSISSVFHSSVIGNFKYAIDNLLIFVI